MRERVISFLGLVMVLLWATGCNQDQAPAADSSVLLQVDRDFSALAGNSGMNNAFYEFAHHDAVVLRDGNPPIKGKELLKETFWSEPDTGFLLSWDPVEADISTSADLGYTYGIYTLKIAGSDAEIKGTYVTIWKKDPEGNWKFVLDAGTEGLEKEIL